MTITKRSWIAMAMALCALLCVGCKPPQSQTAKAEEDDELGLKVQVLNYTDIPLGVVYVNGVWAGNMSSHAGGHSLAAAIGVPAKWRPGLTVEVEWQDDLRYNKDPNGLYKAQVSVERYPDGDPASLWLAFLPDHKIRAIASRYTLNHPNFPANLKFPFDACMADAACATEFYPERIPVHQQDKSNG